MSVESQRIHLTPSPVVSIREIEYLKKETQRCAQEAAEASVGEEEAGQIEEQVQEVIRAKLMLC